MYWTTLFYFLWLHESTFPVGVPSFCISSFACMRQAAFSMPINVPGAVSNRIASLHPCAYCSSRATFRSFATFIPHWLNDIVSRTTPLPVYPQSSPPFSERLHGSIFPPVRYTSRAYRKKILVTNIQSIFTTLKSTGWREGAYSVCIEKRRENTSVSIESSLSISNLSFP